MALKTLSMKWAGISPLVMNNGQMADPLCEIAKSLGKVTSKRKKTDADHEQISKIQFFGSLYIGKNGPIIPLGNVESCIIDGAKKLRRGTDAKSAIYVVSDSPIEYDGPKTPDELWSDGRFVLRTGVKQNKVRVMKTRAIFRNWSITTTIEYDDTLLNQSDILEFANRAGLTVGICDWKPKYGRFRVENT